MGRVNQFLKHYPRSGNDKTMLNMTETGHVAFSSLLLPKYSICCVREVMFYTFLHFLFKGEMYIFFLTYEQRLPHRQVQVINVRKWYLFLSFLIKASDVNSIMTIAWHQRFVEINSVALLSGLIKNIIRIEARCHIYVREQYTRRRLKSPHDC